MTSIVPIHIFTILFGPLKVLSVSLELVSSLFFPCGLFISSPTHFRFLGQTSRSTIFLLLSRSFLPFKFTFLYEHRVSPICLVYLDVAPSVSHVSFLLFIILSILTLKFMMYKMSILWRKQRQCLTAAEIKWLFQPGPPSLNLSAGHESSAMLTLCLSFFQVSLGVKCFLEKSKHTLEKIEIWPWFYNQSTNERCSISVWLFPCLLVSKGVLINE